MIVGMSFRSHCGLLGKPYECCSLYNGNLTGLDSLGDLDAYSVAVADFNWLFHIYMVAVADEHEFCAHLLNNSIQRK